MTSSTPSPQSQALSEQVELLGRNLVETREELAKVTNAYAELLRDYSKSGTATHVLASKTATAEVLTAIVKYISVCERTKHPVDPAKLYTLIMEAVEK